MIPGEGEGEEQKEAEEKTEGNNNISVWCKAHESALVITPLKAYIVCIIPVTAS